MSKGNGAPEMVSVTINGRAVKAEKNRLLIDVAEELGVFVPRFCYHPGMKSVAVCRMCLVQIEGMPKLMPACATPVADEMVVNTVSEDAVDAQQGMLEFLLINHPLDCPICDRAGECPLQDQTYAHGPGSSRYIEQKRTYEKALEISDLVVLDRERCVLCWRCVRFADEIAGDRFIQLVDRGPGTQILTFSDEPFDSYFSGNTIQICPVGALTSKPYRFVSRPWDLQTAPSVCSYCSVGCPISNESRAGKLVRCQALPNERVNDFWTCDKGRYAYHYVDSEDRLKTPLVREDDRFVAASWASALEQVTDKLKDAKVGVIAGGHLTTEDAFAISRLARKTLKTKDIDSRLQDGGAPYEVFIEVGGAAGSSATIDDLDRAKNIVWIGPDPKEVVPVLYLRLRKAVIDSGAQLTVVSPRRHSLHALATNVLSDAGQLSDLTIEDAVVCWGPSSPGRDETDLARAAAELATRTGGKILVCPPHAGSQGMLDMGVHPGLEPGYQVVSEPGRDTRAILEAAAAGELDVLLIFGADPIADFPDADLARRALESEVFTVVVELLPTETVERADVVFPSAAYAEREGTFTNLERRLQKLEVLLPPPGTSQEPWQIVTRIATALGDDWNWNGFDDVWTTLKAEVPTHASVDVDALAQDMPLSTPEDESPFEVGGGDSPWPAVAGPGAQYPRGYRQGAPFQTGQNWPLSWELRAFEAEQRPGHIPSLGAPSASASPPVRSDSPRDGAASGDSAPAELALQSGPPSPPGLDEELGARAGQAGAPGTFELITGRLLYDEGAMVRRTQVLRGLQRKPFVEINDEDAKALSIADGDEIVVRANGSEATVVARIGGIVQGAVFLPYDLAGLRANAFIPAGRVEVAKL